MFHSPGKFLDGIFHSVNLRMGLVQEPAEKKMRIPVPIEQAEYALSGSENSSFPVLSVKQICWFSFISKSPLNRNSRLFLAAWLLALLYLLPDPQQLFVVVLACAGRVDAHTDMFETPVLMEH